MIYLFPVLVFFLCGMSFVIGNAELECQAGWQRNDNQCYRFSDVNATRDEAKQACESLNATLVTIGSQNVNTFLKQQITGNTSFWIGLRMYGVDSSAWRWNTGGTINSRSSALYWCDDETDPYTGCAVMKYNPEPCLISNVCYLDLPFICENVVPQTELSCPANWMFKSDNTHRCYFMSDQKMTRMNASRYCWNIGGRLVTVPTGVVKTYLTEKRPTTDNQHWVGLSPYKWDDGTAFDWDNWDDQGPHIGNQCARILPNGMWRYGICSMDKFYFICQTAASPFTTAPTTEPSTASSTATTQVTIEDTTISTMASTATSTIKSSTTSANTRTALTSSISRIAEMPTTYTPETVSNTENVTPMSAYSATDTSITTTIHDAENTALGNSETTTTKHNENDVPIILYVLIGIYTAVGMTAVVFIGLLAKYISLRRRYEKLNDETPNETEIDDIDLDDNNDNKLYENQEYVSVDPHESITSGKATVPQNVETDNVVYSDIDVDSGKPKDGNHIETKETSGHTDTHHVNHVPFKQNNHDLSKREHVEADDEHSEQEETSHLYYNDPDCIASVTNSEQVNIYDDPINVTISESDDKDV